MDGRRIKDLHKCGEEMIKNSSLPSREQQEISELNGSGGGEREGDKGAKTFCPGRRHQPGKNSLAPLSPSLSPRPSHSAYLFLLFLARDRGVLAHFFTTFVKIFIPRPSIGAKGLGLVFLFFLGLYSSFHALEIEKMCS